MMLYLVETPGKFKKSPGFLFNTPTWKTKKILLVINW